MGHNGGQSQSQNWFLEFSDDFLFINKIKTATRWGYSVSASGRPAASIIDANGYPTSVAGGSIQLTIRDEGTTYRPGNRVLVWDGTATFTVAGTTLQSGSLSGGRAVLSLNTSTSPITITIVLTATNGSLNNLRWMHADDEAR